MPTLQKGHAKMSSPREEGNLDTKNIVACAESQPKRVMRYSSKVVILPKHSMFLMCQSLMKENQELGS